MPRPALLIESWLPIDAMGAESRRENSTGQHPPVNRLHVWWARRPLTTSRAAILAGLLPAWTADFPPHLLHILPDQQAYHAWFLRVIGILGDPVAARKKINWEKQNGIRSAGDKYGYPRAFTSMPMNEDMEILCNLFEFAWGSTELSVLDPFAGGGSIPFESMRFGLRTYANDLNPVAATILKATLEFPVKFGGGLAESLIKWGNRWHQIARARLAPFYAPPDGQSPRTIYMWVRTVKCPVTGKPVPLAPNWWVSSKDPKIAVRMVTRPEMTQPRFEVVTGKLAEQSKPDEGTINRGVARSPWTGETIDGEYIKAEAQAGRMGQLLYCVEVQSSNGREYKTPLQIDIDLYHQANIALLRDGFLNEEKNSSITQLIPDGLKTSEPLRYGIPTWGDMFSPRQLLSHLVFLETLDEVAKEICSAESREKAEAIKTYLAFALDKCLNYNSRLSSWHASRKIIRSVFDRHDFAFAWTYTEFNGAGDFLLWGINQVVDAYRDIASLVLSNQTSFTREAFITDPTIYRGSASRLSQLTNNSVHNITVDPPYYDNVMYAELADFFYVWLKRSVGPLFPEFFSDELTNKDDEAVANPARFAVMGGKKKQLANDDYERKMAAAFREMHRVLRDDGALTVMFTHKKVAAWDTLASALIGAGFSIQASWPVHTESEHSLHQAKKNAASSTILLVCRKREQTTGTKPVFWDDLQGEVRRVAREKAAEYAAMGISGADLYISAFGPALSVISQQWPVLTSQVDPKTGEPKLLRPETALDLAREEVVRLRKEGLLAGREVQFDAPTDWYLLAWDAYRAEQFPYDEARKMAVALGVDLDHDLMQIKRLASKKGDYVTMAKPSERRRDGMVDEELFLFPHWIDAAHTAMMIFSEDGAGACDAFLMRSGLKRDATFKALLQTLINAIPRNKEKGRFVRPEAEVLDNLRLAFFDDLTVLVEEALPAGSGYVQDTLTGLDEEGEEEEGEEQ